MNDFNTAPKGLREIKLEQWTGGMFQYQIEEGALRQVRNSHNNNEGTFDLECFDLKGTGDVKLGFALMKDWYDNKNKKCRKKAITRFCIYGTKEEWREFQIGFAKAQGY